MLVLSAASGVKGHHVAVSAVIRVLANLLFLYSSNLPKTLSGFSLITRP